jgi:hypothetical protein
MDEPGGPCGIVVLNQNDAHIRGFGLKVPSFSDERCPHLPIKKHPATTAKRSNSIKPLQRHCALPRSPKRMPCSNVAITLAEGTPMVSNQRHHIQSAFVPPPKAMVIYPLPEAPAKTTNDPLTPPPESLYSSETG